MKAYILTDNDRSLIKTINERKITPPWDNDKIRLALRMTGYAMHELDEIFDMPSGSIQAAVVRGHTKGEEIVAGLLGVNKADLWPKRYVVERVTVGDPSVYDIQKQWLQS